MMIITMNLPEIPVTIERTRLSVRNVRYQHNIFAGIKFHDVICSFGDTSQLLAHNTP